jgi:hypothetical protein
VQVKLAFEFRQVRPHDTQLDCQLAKQVKHLKQLKQCGAVFIKQKKAAQCNILISLMIGSSEEEFRSRDERRRAEKNVKYE